MLRRRVPAAALAAMLALAACGAPGEPDGQTDLGPPAGSVAVVGEL